MDALIEGTLHFSSPESYRLSKQEGICDHNESCSHSFRDSRGDQAPKLTLGGREIEGLTAATIHVGGRKDMWLHCWSALDIPQDDDGIGVLATDINRMRREFGSQYAFIPCDRLKQFADVLKGLTQMKFEYGRVRYSNDQKQWSVGCKSKTYEYQREYRFAVGECKHTSIEPLRLIYPLSFKDYIAKNPILKITNEGDDAALFKLDQNECCCDAPSRTLVALSAED